MLDFLDDLNAVSVCYVVNIDDHALGTFHSVEGLGCEFVMETREEGGNNGVIWQLPTRIKYSNVKLTRPVSAFSSQITKWFASQAKGVQRKTATIEARTLAGITIAKWSLVDVVPVRWSGPQLSPDQSKPATETLELAHHGFISDGLF